MANEDVKDVGYFGIAIIVIGILCGTAELAYLACRCYIKGNMFAVGVAIVSGIIAIAFAIIAICSIVHFIKD